MKEQLNLAQYLDSTYLKTVEESGLTKLEHQQIVIDAIDDAIEAKFACIMIRPEFVAMAKERIEGNKSKLKVGTVVDFPFGNGSTEQKLTEARSAIENGAYDIDFVCDYNAFKRGSFDKFDVDILEGTRLVVEHKKIAKWIIETGALSRDEIREISKRISKIVKSNFPQQIKKIYVKTSTGYYGGYGATVKDVKTIKSAVGNLQVKASGGVSNIKECLNMIDAGATRIGTSRAKEINNEK